VQVGSPALLFADDYEVGVEALCWPCDDAYRRACFATGNSERGVFTLTQHGSLRDPSEGVRDSIFQIRENAAPVITMTHKLSPLKFSCEP
jgi:hypothetical protein